MAQNSFANLDALKQHNLASLFKIIVEFGLISRTQLIEESRLAAGSVTKLTRLLLDQGLVHEVAQAESERGRKAILLAPRIEGLQVLAARADRHHLYVGLCDLSGHLLLRYSEPLKVDSEQDFANQVIRALRQFLASNQAIIQQVVGIGITLPGLIDAEHGIVNFMPHIPVSKLSLGRMVSDALGYPCLINNFSSAMALAEKQIGASFDTANSLFVEVHNGVGAGLIVNDQLYSGIAVGELGHVQVDPLGERCICGNYGCLETVVSNPAILARYQRARKALQDKGTDKPVTMEQLTTIAGQGDETAAKVLQEAAQKLGMVLAMSANLIRPEKIVIAGEITQAWEIVSPVLEQSIHRQSLQIENAPAIKVVRSELYGSPWYSGYALVRQGLLNGSLLKLIMAPSKN